MKSYKVEQIRNVAFVGHAGAGKTSIVESLLYLSGVSDRLGKVGDNSSIMDYDPDEVRRGHSINASFAVSEWQKYKFNILDTPGNGNFIADTPGCIRVSDGVVVVIAADAGFVRAKAKSRLSPSSTGRCRCYATRTPESREPVDRSRLPF